MEAFLCRSFININTCKLFCCVRNAMAPRSRSWIFTLNNPTVEPDFDASGASYLCFGREVGLLGTPHLQGFVQFSQPKSLAQLRAIIPGAHLEVRKGTFRQAIAYCEKDGNFVEFGVRPLDPAQKGDKEKERWKAAWELAKAGKLSLSF